MDHINLGQVITRRSEQGAKILGEILLSHILKDPDSNRWKLNIISYLGMLNVGMVFGSLGPLLVPISDFFQLRLSQVAYPMVFFSAGFLLATVTMSLIWQIHRGRLLLIFSSLSLLLSSVSIVLLHASIGVILALLFFVGLSAGTLNTSLASLFSEVYGDNRTKHLNILHVFFSLGAFVGPLLVGLVLSYAGWYLVYLFMGLFNFPLPIFFWGKKLNKYTVFSEKSQSTENYRVKRPLSSALFWLVVFAMFLYTGVEGSFISWVPMFLTKVRNVSPVIASYSVSIFWLTVIAGRALFGYFLHKTSLFRSLIVGTGGAAFFIGLSFLGRGVTLIVLFLACSGLLLSFVYPSLLALGGNVFPEYIGFVTGALISGAFIGHMFFPWLIGAVSQMLGLAKGVLMIPLLSVALATILMYLRYSLAKEVG